MVAATKTAGSSRSGSGFWSNRLYVGWLAIASLLFLFGVGGFFYLRSNSALSLLEGSDRPIAAATLFVPSQSPFALSLLTQPEQLATFVQSLEAPEQRPQTLEEIEQVKQRLLEETGLDRTGLGYEQLILPWIGDEVTFALVSADLDLNPLNGKQLGYLTAVEIAPNRQQQAREFLQLFWQQQALAGSTPSSEKISGVRILSAASAQSQSAQSQSARSPEIRATALVGDQFILLANDVRVLQHSLQVAQSAKNLAQNLAYRNAAALPKARVGLAYFDLNLLDDSKPDHSFAAVSIGLAKNGLIANALPSNTDKEKPSDRPRRASESRTAEALKFLPENSELTISGSNFSKLKANVATLLPAESLPALLKIAPKGRQWDWATGEYAIGKTSNGRSQDWVLVIERDQAGIAALDEWAIASGYSKVPILIGDTGDVAAIAWTRLTARKRDQFSGSELETDLLGLHLQRDRYEFFAGSLAAMNSALAVAAGGLDQTLIPALVESERFRAAIAPLTKPNQGYVYLDWPAIAPTISRKFPTLNQVAALSDPFFSYIETVAATRQGEEVSVFVHIDDTHQE